jgi:hypothetical protein
MVAPKRCAKPFAISIAWIDIREKSIGTRMFRMFAVFILTALLCRSRLALRCLLKISPFLRSSGLSPVRSVPDYRADKTEDVSAPCRDQDQCKRRTEIGWFDNVNWPDHMHPKNEIEDWLRPPRNIRADQTKCQSPINVPITSPTLFGLTHCQRLNPICVRSFRSDVCETRWVTGQRRV